MFDNIFTDDVVHSFFKKVLRDDLVKEDSSSETCRDQSSGKKYSNTDQLTKPSDAVTSVISNSLQEKYATKEEVDTGFENLQQNIRNIITEELNKMIEFKKENITKEPNTCAPEDAPEGFELHVTFNDPVLVIPAIRHIEYSTKPGKEQVTVIFEDLSIIRTKPAKGDAFDLKIGVAMAITERMFGSKTAFRKYIAEHDSVAKRERKQEIKAAKKAKAADQTAPADGGKSNKK